jgi:flagellin
MQISGLGGFGALSGNVVNSDLQLRKVLQKLATGLSINQASDDAAGLAISQRLETQVRGFKMALQNVSDADSALSIADGVGGQTAEILQRQRELALQASNATLTDNDRKAIDTEYQQLTQQLDQQANGAQYNTQKVANGTGLAGGTAQIQAGPNAGDTVSAPQVSLTANALGITGSSVATANQAQAAIGTIDNALDSLNSQRSTVGAFQNRLGHEYDNLSTGMINSQAAQSVISDEDMAKGISDLTIKQLLNRTSTAAFGMFNQVAQNSVMGLLGQL